MNTTRFDTPEDAYFGFFEADAAQDGDAWAAVMSYPHVRVAASGDVLYFETARDYADDADWSSRVATGWVRTRGLEPMRLHESSDRVLLLGGWTRFNADDEPILWNRVTYILTKPGGLHGGTPPATGECPNCLTRQRSGKAPPAEGSWGIQARFALGTYDGSDDEVRTNLAAEAATGVVRRYYDALSRGDGDACAGLCRFPMIDVGVGDVTRIESGIDLAQQVGRQTTQFANLNITAAQSGPKGVNVAVTADYASGGGEQTIVVVGRDSGTWRIAGISRMRMSTSGNDADGQS